MFLPKMLKTMTNSGITIGNMKNGIFFIAVLLLFLGGCELCNTSKIEDGVMPRFTTGLPVDSFQVGQPIPFYLVSNVWPSLYDGEIITAERGKLTFNLLVNSIHDSGLVNAAYLMNVTSDIAEVTPGISNVDSQIHRFSLEMDLDGDTYLSVPAFVFTPLDTGRFTISFELGALATVIHEKKGKCDQLMEMSGSFTENEFPNQILDQAGINYQYILTLPGGIPQQVIPIYGFYVKP